jgi:hypothetical protein
MQSPGYAGTAIGVMQYYGQGFWLAAKRLSQKRFKWRPTGDKPARTLQAHQAQLLLAAGNPGHGNGARVAESELNKLASVPIGFPACCGYAGNVALARADPSAASRLLS